jgi:hypothetical protein
VTPGSQPQTKKRKQTQVVAQPAKPKDRTFNRGYIGN